MCKHLILSLCLALGIHASGDVQASIFSPKIYSTGTQIKDKPMALHAFMELRGAHPTKEPMEFKDFNGNSHKLSDYRGKLLILDMWGTWCEPCVRSIPALTMMQKKYDAPDSKIRFVSVSIDDEKTEQKKWLKKHGFEDFQTWLDPKMQLDQIIPVEVVPCAFVFDGSSNLVGFVRGYIDWGDEEVPAYLEKLAQKYAHR